MRHLSAIGLLSIALLLGATQAEAYKLGGRKWPGHTITYFNAATASTQALKSAVEAWNDSGADIRFVATSRAKAHLLIAPLNHSILKGAGVSELGLATVGWVPPGHTFISPLGKIQGDRVWLVPAKQVPNVDKYGLAQVAAHELGHVLGLNHETHQCADMNADLNERCIPQHPWEERCRILEPDDIRGAIARYGGKVGRLSQNYCELATLPGAPTALSGTATNPNEGGVTLNWTNPPGITFAQGAQFTLGQIAGQATVESYVVDAMQGSCAPLSFTANALAINLADASTATSALVYVPEPGTWCFTVGVDDAFQRLGVPGEVTVSVPASAGASPSAKTASVTGATKSSSLPYLSLAETGVNRAQGLWRNRSHHWYDERLDDKERYPLATIWGSVPLFEALNAIEQAAPSQAHRAALSTFATGAEHFLDRDLGATPGFAPYQGDRGKVRAWFDDNGWWGLGFMDAYNATHNPRFLHDAEHAFAFIAAEGWDAAGGGGLWWNTSHPYRAGEPLAAGSLLGALLYRSTHAVFYLDEVNKFLTWADAHFLTERGLYKRTESDPTPTPYIEGPLVEAHQILCETGEQSACARARSLANASWERFQARLNMGPQFDTIYLHWMLIYGSQTGDSRWRALAETMAASAQTDARESDGLYLRAWDGSSINEHQARPDMLQTDAATLELFGWLAAIPAQ